MEWHHGLKESIEDVTRLHVKVRPQKVDVRVDIESLLSFLFAGWDKLEEEQQEKYNIF